MADEKELHHDRLKNLIEAWGYVPSGNYYLDYAVCTVMLNRDPEESVGWTEEVVSNLLELELK